MFVGNLNYQTTREELTTLLSAAGSIVDIRLPTDRETGRPRGFAFVEFSNETEAAAAIRLFNERELGGRKLVLNPADDRPRGQGPRPPRPFDAGSGSGSAPPWGGGARPSRQKPFKTKGSRRGLRARKRSL